MCYFTDDRLMRLGTIMLKQTIFAVIITNKTITVYNKHLPLFFLPVFSPFKGQCLCSQAVV